eukprot:scaffold360_cov77-Skeletonema_marinoi.AAC.10
MAHSLETQPTKKVKLDDDVIRKEQRVTSGVSVIIKSMVTFYSLEKHESGALPPSKKQVVRS